MKRKALIIGSNSFSGASFASYLLDQGFEVIGVSRSPEPNDVFLPYRWKDSRSAFRFQKIDLNTDLEALEALIKKESVPFIVNFAAQSMVGESWKNPDHWMMTNVVSTVRLFEVLRRAENLERYVHVTTPEVYGSTEGFIKEDAVFNPSTPYAVSRAAGDMSLRMYIDTYKLPAMFTRAANVYGPGQQLYRIIPRTILFMLMGRKLHLHGGGHSVRSFIHMHDVSDATLRILEKGKIGDTYHISTNDIISIRGVVERIAERLGVSFDEHVEVVGERLGKDAAYKLDSSKLRQELGWKDVISLDKGIDECIGWVKSNLETLRQQPLDYIHKA